MSSCAPDRVTRETAPKPNTRKHTRESCHACGKSGSRAGEGLILPNANCCWRLLRSVPAVAQNSVSFAWDPSPTESVIGYKLYVGVSSRVYTHFINCGNVTTYTVHDLPPGSTYLLHGDAI